MPAGWRPGAVHRRPRRRRYEQRAPSIRFHASHFTPNTPGHASPLASHLRLAHLSAMRKTGERFDYDLAVIGGGSGGYAAARTAVAEGLKTVVLEGGEEVGGLCILRGCMPTKALLYAAEVMHLASHPEPWGIRTEKVSYDFAR